MSSFDRHINGARGADLMRPAVSKLGEQKPGISKDIGAPSRQPMGNQAMQRFAETCPISLPNPGVCPFGGICHSCPPKVQAKLTVNEPGDKYEEEADRVADQVMRMPEPGPIQRASISPSGTADQIQRSCTDCEDELQRKPIEE